MQDKDFDRLIREALENQAEPAYNPADWDLLEDRLHQLQFQAPQTSPQANPAAGSSAGATGGLAKIGFAASAVLFTALNAANLIQPEIFETPAPASQKPAIEVPALPAEETAGLQEELAAETSPVSVKETPAAGTAATVSEAAQPAAAETTHAKADVARTGSQKVTKENTVFLNGSSFLENAAAANGQNGGVLAAKQPAAGNPASVACAGNSKPELATVLRGNDTLYTNRLSLYTCESLNLKLNAQDKEADKISFTSNVASVLPGAQLTVSENGTAQLIWNAKPEMARNQAYNFTIWLNDSYCPNAEPKAYNYAVNVLPAFTATLNGGGRIERGQTMMLEVTGAPQGATFRWSGPDGKANAGKNAYLAVTPQQTATYKVQVISQNGCMFTDSARVEVLLPKPVMPNVITPNNDGRNDFLEVTMPTDEPVRLEVFDRRGRQVYENDNYANDWNAEGLPAGTYDYRLYQGGRSYIGWVEVIR